jgi:hypothetical protein
MASSQPVTGDGVTMSRLLSIYFLIHWYFELQIQRHVATGMHEVLRATFASGKRI